MRKEYALQGVGYFKHWSDAYPTLGYARRAGKALIHRTTNEVHIMQRIPLPPGHQIGARWRVVGIVSESPEVMRKFAECHRTTGAPREIASIEAAERGFAHGSREWEDFIERREAELTPD